MAMGWQLALVGVLVIANAAFAGSEIALVSLREGQLQRMERQSRTGRLAAQLARDPNRFLATIQIGITLAGFLASATAAVTLAEPVVGLLESLGAAARPVAIVLITLLLTFVTLVLGELAPKRVAMQKAESWARVAARPLAVVAAAARPAVWLLSKATDLAVSIAGADPERGRESVTVEEIRDLVATTGVYSKTERQVITGSLEATSRTLRQVLQPRALILAFQQDVDAAQARRRLVEAGHTRAPVYARQIDDADRIVSLLDLVDRQGTVGRFAHGAVVLPESASLLDGLRQMQSRRELMALVVSEYAGVEGIVTIEDLVEELVGEIHDEYDRDTEEVVRNEDGSITVVGHLPVHDLAGLGVDLPSGNYVSISGLIQERLGRLANPGDHLDLAGWRIDVLSTRGRAIARVRLQPKP